MTLPAARHVIANHGDDRRSFRDVLAARGISACSRPTRNRQIPIRHDPVLYRQRHRIKIVPT